MTLFKNLTASACIAAAIALAPAPAFLLATTATASEIKYVVNGTPVTSYDIQRRAAFLRIQNRKGNLNALAADDMVEQVLKTAEVKRLGIRITDAAVDEAYARFAKSNNLPIKQLDAIMAQSGVTKAHFKEFIRTQMGWNQALGVRSRTQNTTQDAVKRMLQDGGSKPSATEYMLQQVIFVVPAAERKSLLPKRKRDAQALRERFRSCDSTREFAKGLLDVTVRDLGRVLEPELPPEWAEQIKKTKVGGATSIRDTDRGVEFIGICSSKEVSDDRVAQLVLGSGNNQKADEISEKYLAELKKRAKISQR